MNGSRHDTGCGGHHLSGPWRPGPLPLDLHDDVSGSVGEFNMVIADIVYTDLEEHRQ